MDDMEKKPDQIPREEGYSPRPARQVWGARFALVIFLLFVAWQVLEIALGGL